MNFKQGMKHGLPIGMGYFAVSFSLGIAAHEAGITAFPGFMMSALTNASAGEYAGISAIRDCAPYLELALLILITNARYLLMSCAMSQRLPMGLPVRTKLLVGFYISDELFALASTSPYPVQPKYLYGAYSTSFSLWAVGTVCGILAGDLLPVNIVQALSAAIFGMFLAVVIPAGRQNKTLMVIILTSFAVSTFFAFMPVLSSISENTRIIILTLVISAIAAIVKPVPVPAELEAET